MIRKEGEWKVDHAVLDDPRNEWEFRRVAIKYINKGMEILDQNKRTLNIETFLEDVIKDKSNAVYVARRTPLNTKSQERKKRLLR